MNTKPLKAISPWSLVVVFTVIGLLVGVNSLYSAGPSEAEKFLKKLTEKRKNISSFQLKTRTAISRGFSSVKAHRSVSMDAENNRFHVKTTKSGSLIREQFSNGETVWDLEGTSVRKYKSTDHLFRVAEKRYNPYNPVGFLAEYLEVPVTTNSFDWSLKKGTNIKLNGSFKTEKTKVNLTLTFEPNTLVPKTRVTEIKTTQNGGGKTEKTYGTSFQSFETNPELGKDTFSFEPGKQQNPGNTIYSMIGTKLSNFELKEYETGKIHSVSTSSKPMLIFVWRGNNRVSKQEMPKIEKLYKSFGSQISVLGTTNAPESYVTSFKKKHEMSYPVLHEQKGTLPKKMKNMNSFPSTLLVDSDGTVLNILQGTNSYGIYHQEVTSIPGVKASGGNVAAGNFGNVEVPDASTASSLQDAKGKQLTNLNLKEVGKSKKHDITKYQGNVVLINVWRTWCGPCRGEIPGLKKLAKKYKDKNVKIIGTSNESESKVQNFASSQGINYLLLLEKKGTLPKIYQFIRGVPTTIILDKNGVIQFVESGAPRNPEKAFGREIEKLLKK